MTNVPTGTVAAGATLDASDPSFYAESNRPTFLEIHRTDPVYWVDAQHTQPFWNVCRHDLIREIGQDSELFTTEYGVHLNAAAFDVKTSDDPLSSGGLTADLPVALRPANVLDAENHRRVRNPVNAHFRPRAALDLESGVCREVRCILDDIEPDLEADFMRTFATRVPLLATTRLLGVSPDREHDFEIWANTILESFEPGATPDFVAIGEMVAFFSAEVAARKQSPRDDLITQLTQTDLSDDEVVMWCWLLLVAGLETTGNVIGAGLDLLLRDPEAKSRLVADPSLIPDATAEMLRVVTPGRYIRRTATADTVIGGRPIRRGDAVVMNFTVANYDPEMFTDPLKFDIDRRPSPMLAFSYGPHHCIGAAVARLELRIAFEELLSRFANVETRGPAVYRPSLATVVVESIPVVFRP
jgi:cholest-4-en-3-one 26-monooxygenase